MANAKNFDKASGIFFFSGFMLSKLQYLPFPLASAIFRIVSLGSYLLAYGSWFTANLLHPGHKEREDKWYGFAKIKEQFLFSSLIGFAATVLSVVAIALPIFFLPAAWLFLLGNLIWTIGEYHKLNNPPTDDADFSKTRQQSYFTYAATTTTISLITALAATLMLIFPPAAIPITIFSLLVCVGLGAFAFQHWLDSSFGDHEASQAPSSHNKMGQELAPSPSAKKTHEPAPYHGKNPLATSTAKESKHEIKLQPSPQLADDADLDGHSPCSAL